MTQPATDNQGGRLSYALLIIILFQTLVLSLIALFLGLLLLLNFGLFGVSSPFERAPEVFHPLTDVHELAAFALLGLALGHILAALYHQIVRKDAIMGRMTLKA